MSIGWVRKNNNKNINNLLTFVFKNINKDYIFKWFFYEMWVETNFDILEKLSPRIKRAIFMIKKIRWYSEEESDLNDIESRINDDVINLSFENKYRKNVWNGAIWLLWLFRGYLDLL